MMLSVSILLILEKDKGNLHIIILSLFYFCFFSFVYPQLFHKKHNMGMLMLQTHLPSNGVFKKVL